LSCLDPLQHILQAACIILLFAIPVVNFGNNK
jgi:hypothetical protein